MEFWQSAGAGGARGRGERGHFRLLNTLAGVEIAALTYRIIQAAIEVHRQLGPGLLEVVYERCFALELRARGFAVEQQVRVPIAYKGQTIGKDLVIDLIIDGEVIVEVKALTENHPVHQAQLLTYLKLSGLQHGLVINFGLSKLTDGVRSVINTQG